MSGKSTWVAVAGAVAVVILLIVVITQVWAGLGDSGMSTGGWVALVLGVLATLALGIGLMALVFISSRRGYDEAGRGPGQAGRPPAHKN